MKKLLLLGFLTSCGSLTAVATDYSGHYTGTAAKTSCSCVTSCFETATLDVTLVKNGDGYTVTAKSGTAFAATVKNGVVTWELNSTNTAAGCTAALKGTVSLDVEKNQFTETITATPPCEGTQATSCSETLVGVAVKG
jgi:hypothetical protein